MRQTINISLAGISFSVETEGYKKLKNYFSSIEKEYDNPLEATELTSDIETRIAELILNRQTNTTPVTEETIDGIIAQMGFPIDDEQPKKSENTALNEEQSKKSTPPPYEESRKIAHRLYRNPDGAMCGGVCAGLAAYFNIDVVIIRLLFFIPLIISIILPFFSLGSFFLNLNLTTFVIYLILWIVIPKARTPRQILEMQGESVTKENMERFLKDEMMDMDSNISRITRSEKSATLLSSIIFAIGQIIKFILYMIGSLIILGICIAICVGIGHIIYGAIACNTYFTNLLSGNIYLNITAAIITGVIPLIIFLLILIRPIFKIYPKKSFYIILSCIWLAAIIYGSIIGIKSYLRYSHTERYEQRIEMPIQGGTLYIKQLNPDTEHYGTYDNLYIDKDMMMRSHMYIDNCDKHELKDSTVIITLKKFSHGKTYKEAFNKAKEFDLEYKIEGDTLFVNNHYKCLSADDILNRNNINIHRPSHIRCVNTCNR